ncbi:Scr1 family TA system antitoxin-like transcriptional regulator [Kitasatospora sp. NPDC001175]|uniref:Scr1 family TA system antitoxin-like transcriptional regulator n=1 Tax=Kitasatospora sp. NPDC001175 TaxID=3157103 RepID=UPI003CFDFD70
MVTSASSSAQQARQVLADRLGEIRRDAGLTGRDLAGLCGWHPSKSSRIENARTPPSADDIHAWCLACGAEDQTTDLIASLRAVEGMWVEWQRMERAGLRQAQEAVLPLFERTRRFRSYSSWLVPGLIQTRAYTEAVLRAVQRRRVAVDDVDAAVAVRMERQHVLSEGDHRFAFLVEESVLRSAIGGIDVLAGQLGHLVTVGSLPNVNDNGSLSSDWLGTYNAVPRHLFAPDTIWPGMADGVRQGEAVSRKTDPEAWWNRRLLGHPADDAMGRRRPPGRDPGHRPHVIQLHADHGVLHAEST